MIILDEKIVSVIIPVYNGEKYIERCIESVLNQSFKNIQIIIVDDASTDKSSNIIKKYITANKNIEYYKNISHIGVSETRNIGLIHAQSKYIMFLDCDDWIDSNCISKAIDKFYYDCDIDIVVWEIKTAFSHYRFSPRYEYTYNNILSGKMALSLLSHSLENEFFLSPLLGCKLFKKELLTDNNITFFDTIYEDDIFTYLAFLYSKKVALITGSYLYYYQHYESLTHHFSIKNIEDFFKTFSHLYKYIENTQKESYYRYMNKSLSSMLDTMTNNVSDEELQAKYKSVIFKSFYTNINIEEFYSYSFALTI